MGGYYARGQWCGEVRYVVGGTEHVLVDIGAVITKVGQI